MTRPTKLAVEGSFAEIRPVLELLDSHVLERVAAEMPAALEEVFYQTVERQSRALLGKSLLHHWYMTNYLVSFIATFLY